MPLGLPGGTGIFYPFSILNRFLTSLRRTATIDEVPSINIEELAADYDRKRRMDPAEFKRLLALMLRYGKVRGKVLEIGCGTGFFLLPLARRLTRVPCCGIDIAGALLAQAKARAREMGLDNCFLTRADARDLPLPAGSFDFVLMSQVWHYFPDRPRVAAEVSRVSKSGARLLVITTSHPQLRSQIDLALFPGVTSRDSARMPSLRQIKRLFAGHGFELFATTEFAATFRAASADALAEWVARKPWSSYFLFPEDEFQRRLKIFRRNLIKTFGRGEIVYLVPQTLLFFRKI